MPESLRFWKTRIEADDPEQSFAVGLIYGPSGCGKSSQVKAGLLPRLKPAILPVYLEATAEETELRLLKGLRRQVADLPENLPLAEALAALRRGRYLAAGQKVLLVLDQFEQWLHAFRNEENTSLVQALRHCDGARLQCLVLVRDDFWMAATRFLRELEVRLVEGQNSAAVDLFPLRHAQNVLAAFGRAFGELPACPAQDSKEQKQFIEQAVSGLAEDGKVISVRLALFAEMVKGKPWTPATLRAVGGTSGVGVTFLEETFAARTAPPAHRLHQKAAEAVLKSLLPEGGSEIKGHMRSRGELLTASGYAARPRDFDELLGILDGELRLITPTDPEGKRELTESGIGSATGEKYYQLTHDYLVPSLREWLTRKQKETAKGRAELLLADRAAVWNARPEHRQLPSFWQWGQILWFTRRKQWTGPERRMMASAGRVQATWAAVLLVAAFAITVGGMGIRRTMLADRAATLVEAVLVAPPQAVPYAVENLTSVGSQALPLLRERMADEKRDAAQRLHAAFALAHLGEADLPFLVAQVLAAESGECANLVQAFAHDRPAAIAELTKAFTSAKKPPDRFRLAVLLLQLGEVNAAKQVLKLAADPSQRTTFIHTFDQWRGDLAVVAKLLQETEGADFQSGLCLALGRVPAEKMSGEEREGIKLVLHSLFAQSPHGSVHSASRWALGQWQVELPKPAAVAAAQAERGWYVNPLGMTLLKIPAGSFVRKNDRSNDDLGTVALSRDFWLGDCEVTRGQFKAFLADPNCPESEKPQGWSIDEDVSPTEKHPVNSVSWFDAALFCNWLSRREGLMLAYERTGKEIKVGNKEIDEWLPVATATGYRLPTEAEWEYACRAKSGALYCFGDEEALLTQYAVYSTDKTSPTGVKLPNGFGLHDTHGNLWEWCGDWYGEISSTNDTMVDPIGPDKGISRVLRGGSFNIRASDVRSAVRITYTPTNRNLNNGFRVARTLPLIPFTALPLPAEGGSKAKSA